MSRDPGIVVHDFVFFPRVRERRLGTAQSLPRKKERRATVNSTKMVLTLVASVAWPHSAHGLLDSGRTLEASRTRRLTIEDVLTGTRVWEDRGMGAPNQMEAHFSGPCRDWLIRDIAAFRAMGFPWLVVDLANRDCPKGIEETTAAPKERAERTKAVN